MLATVLRGPEQIALEEVPDPRIREEGDVVIRVILTCICGSDLWPYRGFDPVEKKGKRIGHEALGIVVEKGRGVRTLKEGDLVLMPFAFSDGTCPFCLEGLPTACIRGGFFGSNTPGAQAEAVLIPFADGTLYKLPVGEKDPLLPSLLTLCDVMATGHHAAVMGRVGPGKTVVVIGDGAVGLCAVLASHRLGAGRIILLGHHPQRRELAEEFGATDWIRDEEGAEEKILELTRGEGAPSVLECVGSEAAMATAVRITRPGGSLGYVGLPHYFGIPPGRIFFKNIEVRGGPAPSRAYVSELLPDVLSGRIQPGRVFDLFLPLSRVAEGYRAMMERRAIKVLLIPE